MKRLYLPLILFFILVLEGVGIELLPTYLLIGNSLIIPHWLFIFLIFIAIFYDNTDTYFSVFYGVIFGLLFDVVYTGVLGVYMFSYAIVIYIIHGLKNRLYTNFTVTVLLGILGLSLADSLINTIYMVVGISDMPWKDYFIFRLIPTVLANLLFLIISYPIIKKRLEAWKKEQVLGNNTL